MQPEDVADAVLFLAGQGFMTGIVLPVTGGAHLVSAA
jgi:NAD(P)-dependent dehydrogenase (short-subunit alcohol dehydrogenase family)